MTSKLLGKKCWSGIAVLIVLSILEVWAVFPCRYSEDWSALGTLQNYLTQRGIDLPTYSQLLQGQDVCQGFRELTAQTMSPVLFEKSSAMWV